MGRWQYVGALGLVAIMALGGCSSDSSSESASPGVTSSPATSETDASVPTVAPGSGADAACESVIVDGESTNPELQAYAEGIFSSLDCAASQSVAAQLKAASEDPDLVARAEAAGWDVQVDDVGMGTSMTIQDIQGMTSCQVVGLDSMASKSLICVNV